MLGRFMLVGLMVIVADNGLVYGADPVVVRDVRGRIVRVDPTKNVIVVRTGEGTTVQDTEYLVDANTQYWGSDRQTINDGLRYKGFTEGTDVWYRVGTTPNSRTITEMRFFDPAVPVRNR